MKRYKKFVISLVSLFLIYLFIPFSTVNAESSLNPEDSIFENINYNDVELYWLELINEYGSFLPEIEQVSFRNLVKNNDSLSLKSILLSIGKYFFHEIIVNGKLLSMILILAIFSSILQTLHSAFEQSMISKIAYFIIYLVLFYLALNSFIVTFNSTTSTIKWMSDFILALLPLLLGLLATVGNFLTISFFHPLIVLVLNVTNVIISNFILPLILISFLLMMVSYINDQYRVTYLAQLFRNISLGALGLISTIFITIITIQGTVSAIQDGIALKTAKFVTGNVIPVIGRTFTDAVDVVLSATLVLKNSIGIIGVLIILVYSLFPIIKILVIALIYKLAAALIQPVGEESLVKTINTISNYTFYILACLIAVTFMFFLSVVIIVLASNITMFIK